MPFSMPTIPQNEKGRRKKETQKRKQEEEVEENMR
jgi:hypothetical protein